MTNDTYYVSYQPIRKPLSKSVMDTALNLLFDTYVDTDARIALYDLMQERYKKIGVVVLYNARTYESVDWYGRGIGDNKIEKPIPRKFSIICQKFGLDSKRREVQINEKQQIMFAEDYSFRPRVWKKSKK